MATESALQNTQPQPQPPTNLGLPRCPMCHGCLARVVKLPCGHIYCNLCLLDLNLTAELTNGTSRCKVCGFVIAIYEQQSHDRPLHTVTTVSELVAEAQANPHGFHVWLQSSAIFQQQPQTLKIEQEARDVTQHLLPKSPTFRTSQETSIMPHIAGPLTQTRSTKTSSSPHLPTTQGQQLPYVDTPPKHKPLDAVGGDAFSNIFSGQSYPDLPINQTDRSQAFEHLQPSAPTPRMAVTLSMADVQLRGLHDDRLLDSIREKPACREPQDLAAMKARWEEKRKSLRQTFDWLQAQAQVVDEKLETIKRVEKIVYKG